MTNKGIEDKGQLRDRIRKLKKLAIKFFKKLNSSDSKIKDKAMKAFSELKQKAKGNNKSGALLKYIQALATAEQGNRLLRK